MAAAQWESRPPYTYDIVTGFFPETSPKETWATNPRPLLVCGRAQDPDTGMYFCRVAYGTTKIDKARDADLVIGNMSMLDTLGLKYPTCFVIHSGRQMVILPWTEEFFRPWSTYSTPTISTLPEEMQGYVGHVLSSLTDLPQF